MRWISHKGPLFILVTLFLVLGITYSVTTPIFEAPDEVWHVAYVRYIALYHRLPVQGGHQNDHLARQEASQPPLYYALAALLISWIDTSDFPAVARLNPHAAPGLPHSDGNKNMIVPTPISFPWQGTPLAVHIVRFFSLSLGLITVLATYVLGGRLFTGSEASKLSLLLAALVAFNPQFLFISASVNNDNLMTALAAIALVLGIDLASSPLTCHDTVGPDSLRLRASEESGQSDDARLALLGIVLGLAALTKLTGLLLLPFVLLILLVRAWRHRRYGLRMMSNLLISVTIVTGSMAAIAGWWYMRNWLLYDDVTGLQSMLAWVGQRQLGLREVLSEAEGLELSFWAVFGWFNILVEDSIYTVLKIASRLALFGLIILAIKACRRQVVELKTDILLLTVAWAALVVIGLARWTATTPGSQGRLLFPAITSFATLLLCGLGTLIPQRLRMPILSTLVIALTTLAAIAPFRYIVPAYARPVTKIPTQIQYPVVLRYGDEEIELLGYTVDRQTVVPGESLPITLYMQALQPINRDYSLFIHLWGRDMEWLGQRDSYPGRGTYPTSQWTPGNIIEDRYLVTVAPTATTPARILIEVGFYEFDTGRRLLATSPTGVRTDFPIIGRMKLATKTSTARSPAPYLYSLGDQINLLSAHIETPPEVRAGSTITVVTTWQAMAPIANDYTIFVHVLGQTPSVIAQKDGEPQDGQYPTSLWDVCEIVTDQRRVTLPASLLPGRYTVVTGLYLLATQERLPVYAPTGPVPENQAYIGEIIVH